MGHVLDTVGLNGTSVVNSEHSMFEHVRIEFLCGERKLTAELHIVTGAMDIERIG
jgi:hypothetical protein